MLKTHRLMQLLSLLTDTEARRLGDWLASPFLNKNKRLRRLWQLLSAHHPHYTGIDKAHLRQQLADEASGIALPTDSYLRDMLADLTRQVEQYLLYLLNTEQQPQHRYRLCEALLQRGANTALFEHYAAPLPTPPALAAMPPTAELLFEQYQVHWLSYQHTTLSNNRAVDDSLQKAITYFDEYYIAEKLRMEVLAINRQNVVAGSYTRSPLLTSLLEQLAGQPFDQLPCLTQAYYLAVLLFLGQNTEQTALYDRLTQLLALPLTQKMLPANEQHQLYTLLANYCRIQYTQSGDVSYADDALGLYERMLEQNILYTEQYMSPHQYRNMVLLGILTHRFNWTQHFMEQYRSAIAPEYRTNVHRFNLASLHFATANYRKAHEALRDIQFSGDEFIDAYYHLSYKILLIKTYYETQDHEALLSALESLRIYLHRNQTISRRNRDAYKNFIRLTNRLWHSQQLRQRRTAIADLIQQTQLTAEREWLLNKAQQR